jgi:hypothetical protein
MAVAHLSNGQTLHPARHMAQLLLVLFGNLAGFLHRGKKLVEYRFLGCGRYFRNLCHARRFQQVFEVVRSGLQNVCTDCWSEPLHYCIVYHISPGVVAVDFSDFTQFFQLGHKVVDGFVRLLLSGPHGARVLPATKFVLGKPFTEGFFDFCPGCACGRRDPVRGVSAHQQFKEGNFIVVLNFVVLCVSLKICHPFNGILTRPSIKNTGSK